MEKIELRPRINSKIENSKIDFKVLHCGILKSVRIPPTLVGVGGKEGIFKSKALKLFLRFFIVESLKSFLIPPLVGVVGMWKKVSN